MSSSYSCGVCCPNSYYNSWITPALAEIDAGDTYQFASQQQDRDCYFNLFSPYTANANWIVDNQDIATVGSNGSATAISGGEAYLTASWTGQLWLSDPTDACITEEIPATPTANVISRPKITSISPTRGVVGSTTSVTINGSGFRSGATVSAGSGISVSVDSVTSTQIVADFTITANATGGNRNVTVSVRGVTSSPKTFFVQIPTTARREEITNIVIREPNPGNFVDMFGVTTHENVCGAYRNLKYTLVDQEDKPIEKELHVVEILTDFEPSDPNIPQPPPKNSDTDDEGVFGDQVGVAYTPPYNMPAFNYTLKQAFKVTIGQNTYNLTTKNNVSVSKTAPAQWTVSITNTTP